MPLKRSYAYATILSVIVFLLATILSAHAGTANYTYDSGNRLLRIDYENGAQIVYTYDESGNRTGKTITAQDTTPPVSTATPSAGTYNAAQSVVLTCSDGEGSGCDKIYYTTNGSTPTNTSPAYATAISITATTTLKFFAVDLAGNSEEVRTHNYILNTGNSFQVTVQRDASTPMAGIQTYLFSGSECYLGKSGTTSAAGNVSFNVPAGAYKVRVDYLGYQFWSEVKTVAGATTAVVTIDHRPVNITINKVFNGTSTPLEGVKVYLFSAGGAYLGQSLTTGASGQVTFQLPAQAYKVRADYLGRPYWSTVFNWTDCTIAVPMADAEVRVGRSGQSNADVSVYVFSPANAYLGITGKTDQTSKVTFRLPGGSYKFRADYQGSQYWSAETALAADQVTPVTVETGGGFFTFTVLKGTNTPLIGVSCYVFNATGTYIGLSGTTDSNGQVSFDLSSGSYKVRVDYLGAQFWSNVAVVTGASSLTLLIPQESVDVVVSTAGGPAAGVRVYLFSAAGSYLGLYADTDANGRAYFNLPRGVSFKFRADVMGSPYWSDVLQVSASGTVSVPINTGGGLFRVTVQRSAGTPMEGLKTYLFTALGTYLGLSQTTDSAGQVGFAVPQGSYKVRMDYLGSQFWSEVKAVSGVTTTVVNIEHRAVNITVNSAFNGSSTPLEGVTVYLFSAGGAYLGQSQVTGSNGGAMFEIPALDCKVRVDYLGQQYWSAVFDWTDSIVTVPMGDGEVTVNRSGQVISDVPVYVFSSSNAYLGITGTTDQAGKRTFRLPDGSYKFRADYQGSQYWSSETVLAADQSTAVNVNTGGGSFVFTVLKGANVPLAGVSCYVFKDTGAYIGLSGTTDSAGHVSFDLSNGSYKVRVDYLGTQFWTDAIGVPGTPAFTRTIPHQAVTVTVSGALGSDMQPKNSIPVYLFSPGGAYLALSANTDANGQVTFHLPEIPVKVRADYLGQQFWSGDFTWQNTTVAIPEGTAYVHVSMNGQHISGAPVYVYSAAGSYLGVSGTTDAAGVVEFRLPADSYKFRADCQGNHYWTTAGVMADVVNGLEINAGGGRFVLTVTDGQNALEGRRVYVFSAGGSYLGMYGVSDTGGQVALDLADGSYKFRIDYPGYQHWTDIYVVPGARSATFTIEHRNVTVTISALYQQERVLPGVPVYLFTSSGAYVDQTRTTDENGRVAFALPNQEYKIRMDFLGQQYWSDVFQWRDTDLTIGEGLVSVTALQGGSSVSGAKVYLFNTSGGYLGRSAPTDATGKVEFTPPAGSYQFRVDQGSIQRWSGTEGGMGSNL